jgi:NADPH:quinone reductase-like Zn-dependent oxidoreductase
MSTRNDATTTPSLAFRGYGDESALEWLELPLKPPRPGRVLVKVASVSVNPVDWKILAGEQKLFTGKVLRRPRVFGSDFAGTVAAVGGARPGTPRLELGDRVCGFLNPLAQGSAQGLLEVPAGQCARLPADLDWAPAAALPVAGTTALRTVGLKPDAWWKDKSVYLNGAAGGIGHLLVQLLAALGARVTASASPERHSQLQDMGAWRCLDYRQVGLVCGLDRFDAVIDCHGSLAQASHRSLFGRRGGLFIKVSLANEEIPRAIWRLFSQRLLHGQDSRIMLAIPSRQLLAELAAQVAEGRLKPRIDQRFPAAEARQAVALSRTGHVFGKIIIDLA